MKYINAEKLKEEIQPLYENAKKRAHFASQTGTSSDCAKYNEAKSIYEHILWLIDSLQQEQPEVDLEKEIDDELDRNWRGYYIERRRFAESIKHFYKLCLNARKED